MEETSNNLISGVDGFLRDAFSGMAGLSGSSTNMFNKLGNIKGSLTSALSFENIKMNVFLLRRNQMKLSLISIRCVVVEEQQEQG